MESSFNKTLGLYFGLFNPLHTGHLHIVDKAKEMFDVVKIIRIFSPNKESYPCSKLIDIQYSLDPIILINQFEEIYKKVVVIRGIRNEKDYIFESEYFDQLKLKKSNLKIAYILADLEYKYISSAYIRNLSEYEQKKFIK